MARYHFATHTRTLLSDAGWSQDRRVDTDSYAELFHTAGYPFHYAAREFLSQCGQLSLPYMRTHGNSCPPQREVVIFSPETALANIPSPREDYTLLAQGELTPIGVGHGEYFTFFLSKKGAMYGGFESSFSLIGTTVGEALDTIVGDGNYIRLAD